MCVKRSAEQIGAMKRQRIKFKFSDREIFKGVSRFFSSFVLFTAFLNLCPQTQAQEFLVIGIRGNEIQTHKICDGIGKCTIAHDDTKEFDEGLGATSVQIKDRLVNKSALIVLPRRLNPNTLMEALIKVRIAKTNGAQLVALYSPIALATLPVYDSNNKRMDLPLESFFAVAGAEVVREKGGQMRKLSVEGLDNRSEPSRTYIYGPEHPELEATLSQKLSLPLLDSSSEISGSQIFYLAPFTSPHNEVLFRQLSVMRHFTLKGAKVHFTAPYLHYARSDRMSGAGTTVPGSLVADLIEVSGAQGITFIRAHASQSEGFFKRIPTYHLPGRRNINAYLKSQNIEVLVAPDNGAVKDVTLYAKDLGLDLSVINKKRDPMSDRIELIGISGASVEGKIVAMIDDEISTGGTLAKGSELLKTAGAKGIIVVATHLTGKAEQLLTSGVIDEIVLTNTLRIPEAIKKRVRIISIESELIENLGSIRVDGSGMRDKCIQRLISARGQGL